MAVRRRSVTNLRRTLQAFARSLSPNEEQHLAEACRSVLRTYRSAKARGESLSLPQGRAVPLAFLYLGGDAEPRSRSLRDYDHVKFGPFFGVSDEGSAAEAILAGALKSPKAIALGTSDPFDLGVALDAERLGAVGEVPVGPEEYADIWLGCVERLLMTTNVGTRVNPRLYMRPPVVTFEEGPIEPAVKLAIEKVDERCRPFARTPDRKPRPLTAYLAFLRGSRRSRAQRAAMIRAVRKGLARTQHFKRSVHQLGIGVRIDPGSNGRKQAMGAIDLARVVGCKDVLVIGRVRPRADEQGSLPGLLQYLPIKDAQAVLAHARGQKVCVRVANGIDPDTVARSIWTQLRTARAMGMHLGKYGTFPLTIPDCDAVVGQVQRWFSDWSAAPALFIDQPIVDGDRVYSGRTRVTGIQAWLRTVARHKVPIALIDTIDKAKGWRLLRSRGTRKGLLSFDDVKRLDRFASGLGIRVLWAGGISLPEAYELGKLRPFGIYVTSAASATVPVPGSYAHDPMLPGLKEPTAEGVLRAKLMIEAGFLLASLRDRALAVDVERDAKAFAAAMGEGGRAETRLLRQCQRALTEAIVLGWRSHSADWLRSDLPPSIPQPTGRVFASLT
jgi:hypothetical protein